MGDRRVKCELIGSSVSPPQLPSDRAQALADRAQALAEQAQAFADQAQAQADEAQAPADQVQALATRVQALATQVQAQALATQAQALVAPKHNLDAEEKKAYAYKEIVNLYDINSDYPIHKLALQEWQRKADGLSNTISRREVRSAELTNQVYNIFGWFAVFQGVLLTAVSQQTAHREPVCGKIWFPIVLSGFATGATIVGILQKFMNLKSLELTIHTDTQAKIDFAKRALFLNREGPQKFKFHVNADNSKLTREAKPFWKNRIWVIVSLLIFTGICILSYFVILCDTWVIRNWDRGLHN